MYKWHRLTMIFFKTTMASMSFGSEKKGRWLRFIVYPALIIAAASTIFLLSELLWRIYGVFADIGQLDAAVTMSLGFMSLLIFMLSLMAAPAIFYFAKDVEYLLPLPLPPKIIIGAKFMVALLAEYIVAVVMLIPVFIALLNHANTAPLAINTLVTILTLPIVPLVYSTVLCMVLVSVFKVFKNPDRYTLFIGVVAMFLAIGFSLGIQSTMLIDEDALVQMFTGDTPIFLALNIIFPTTHAAATLTGSAMIIPYIINFSSIGVALIVFFEIAHRIYFRGVVGLSESGGTRKLLSKSEITASSGKTGRKYAAFIREVRVLMRSPTAFLNCVLSAILMPFFFAGAILFSLFTAGEMPETNLLYELRALVDFGNAQVINVVLAGACGVGILMSGMSPVTATAFSREGKSLYVLKFLPVPPLVFIRAKLHTGIAIIWPCLLLIFVPLYIVFVPPLWVFAASMALALMSSATIALLGLLLDAINPKLDWDNENAAIKQNMNVLALVFGGMALGAAAAIAGFFLPLYGAAMLAVLFGMNLAVLVFSRFAAYKYGLRLLDMS